MNLHQALKEQGIKMRHCVVTGQDVIDGELVISIKHIHARPSRLNRLQHILQPYLDKIDQVKKKGVQITAYVDVSENPLWSLLKDLNIKASHCTITGRDDESGEITIGTYPNSFPPKMQLLQMLSYEDTCNIVGIHGKKTPGVAYVGATITLELTGPDKRLVNLVKKICAMAKEHSAMYNCTSLPQCTLTTTNLLYDTLRKNGVDPIKVAARGVYINKIGEFSLDFCLKDFVVNEMSSLPRRFKNAGVAFDDITSVKIEIGKGDITSISGTYKTAPEHKSHNAAQRQLISISHRLKMLADGLSD